MSPGQHCVVFLGKSLYSNLTVSLPTQSGKLLGQPERMLGSKASHLGGLALLLGNSFMLWKLEFNSESYEPVGLKRPYFMV